MIVKTKSGWQVKSADGEKALSAADISRDEAERVEREIGLRQPALVWARERGSFVKD